MAGRLEGKVAIVTGAGSGIGEASARRFAAEGASVLCADIDAGGAGRVSEEIAVAGGRARPFEVDVADLAATEAMAAAALEEWGAIDVLYANAGMTIGRTALTCEPETWDRIVAVNLTGSWLSARAVLPAMTAARRGSIILQASAAGLVGVRGSVAYAAAKGGIIGLCRQLVADYSPDNVRINVIAPGTIVTPLVERAYTQRVQEGRYESVEAGLAHSGSVYPLGRLGTLAEGASLALFLASDESTFITGAVCPIDGGLTATRNLIPPAAQ